MNSVLNLKPLIIASMHLPDLGIAGRSISMAWLEDFVARNLEVFVAGGLEAVLLQDETLNASTARPETIAVMAALGRFAKIEFPAIHLGIIIQAHDPVAPLAVAHAAGAEFVRIKTFVGAMLKAEGIEEGCGIAARDYRQKLGRQDILLMADVHDRSGYPIGNVPLEQAARWAAQAGADALILTGSSFEQSLEYLQVVRAAALFRPLLMGGGVTAENVGQVLRYADGLIVSRAFKRKHYREDEVVRWDLESVKRFTGAARQSLAA
jgi:membrane complex biogenesis BtpA family protein